MYILLSLADSGIFEFLIPLMQERSKLTLLPMLGEMQGFGASESQNRFQARASGICYEILEV